MVGKQNGQCYVDEWGTPIIFAKINQPSGIAPTYPLVVSAGPDRMFGIDLNGVPLTADGTDADNIWSDHPLGR